MGLYALARAPACPRLFCFMENKKPALVLRSGEYEQPTAPMTSSPLRFKGNVRFRLPI